MKKLLRLARDESLDLWSLDEAHFQQHGTRSVMWVPPEDKDPIVYHAPTRSSVALFGAVNVRTGQLVAMLISQFDADTFEAFLGHLLGYRSRSRRMVVILDNARYHQAEQSTLACGDEIGSRSCTAIPGRPPHCFCKKSNFLIDSHRPLVH